MRILYITNNFRKTTHATFCFRSNPKKPSGFLSCPRLGFVNEPSPEGSVVDKTGSEPAGAPKTKCCVCGFARDNFDFPVQKKPPKNRRPSQRMDAHCPARWRGLLFFSHRIVIVNQDGGGLFGSMPTECPVFKSHLNVGTGSALGAEGFSQFFRQDSSLRASF